MRHTLLPFGFTDVCEYHVFYVVLVLLSLVPGALASVHICRLPPGCQVVCCQTGVFGFVWVFLTWVPSSPCSLSLSLPWARAIFGYLGVPLVIGFYLLGTFLGLGTSLMEDMGFGDLVDYSSNTLECIFTTMGELSPINNSYRGWELEQHLGSSVPPQVDNVPNHLPAGSLSMSLLRDGVGFPTSGGSILVMTEPKSSTIKSREVDQNRLYPSLSRGGSESSRLSELSNPPSFLAYMALILISHFLSSPLASHPDSPSMVPPHSATGVENHYASSPLFTTSPLLHLEGRLFEETGFTCGAAEVPIDPPVDVLIDCSITSLRRDIPGHLEEKRIWGKIRRI